MKPELSKTSENPVFKESTIKSNALGASSRNNRMTGLHLILSQKLEGSHIFAIKMKCTGLGLTTVKMKHHDHLQGMMNDEMSPCI